MNPFKKLINQTFFAIFLSLIFNTPDLAIGRVLDRVVAKVNSEIITLSSVEERAEVLKQKYRNDLAGLDEKKILKETIEMMIGEKLQLQEGKKMGLEVDDGAVEAAMKEIERNNGLGEGQLAAMLQSEGRSLESYKNHIRDQILVSKVTRFELGSRIKVSDRKIAKYYHEHQKEFWETGKAKVRHILMLSDKSAPADKRKAKYNQIKEILSEIKNGKDFVEAAKEYSEDVSASSGGDVGFIEKGKMVPAFEEAVYSLREGEISDVVETEFGFHIIKVDEVQRGRTLPLKEVKDKIHYILSAEKQKTAYEDWMNELKKSAFIEISLFDDPKKNVSSDLFRSKKLDKEEGLTSRRKDLSRMNKREVSGNGVNKEQMQEKWEEMYKSVEKTKHQTSGKSSSPLQSLEEKLKAIKKLRSQEKITEAEYQKRKQQLLDGL
ncbi:MAG: peptidylprolyl isomerase [Nitrospinae bacterium]|nr:peptidylprolyl isomerase [Nitrospinota bacterium]